MKMLYHHTMLPIVTRRVPLAIDSVGEETVVRGRGDEGVGNASAAEFCEEEVEEQGVSPDDVFVLVPDVAASLVWRGSRCAVKCN